MPCCVCLYLVLECQAVLAAAGELGVDDRLSAADVSMLAELTGGRRAGLLDVLERFQQSSSEGWPVFSTSSLHPSLGCSCLAKSKSSDLCSAPSSFRKRLSSSHTRSCFSRAKGAPKFRETKGSEKVANAPTNESANPPPPCEHLFSTRRTNHGASLLVNASLILNLRKHGMLRPSSQGFVEMRYLPPKRQRYAPKSPPCELPVRNTPAPRLELQHEKSLAEGDPVAALRPMQSQGCEGSMS